MQNRKTFPIFFDRRQLTHRPSFEWIRGEKIANPETYCRAESILSAVEADSGFFSVHPPGDIPISLIQNVHAPEMLLLYETAEKIAGSRSFYPSVFPKRSASPFDPTDLRQSGYYCYDTGTPLAFNTWESARLSAACAHEAKGEFPMPCVVLPVTMPLVIFLVGIVTLTMLRLLPSG
jgi:acetoin utilization deacetylase AcuC-like enzyme